MDAELASNSVFVRLLLIILGKLALFASFEAKRARNGSKNKQSFNM
jgi:hypothetical protein